MLPALRTAAPYQHTTSSALPGTDLGYSDQVFISMAKALDFIDPDKLSMTVVLTGTTANRRYRLRVAPSVACTLAPTVRPTRST